MRSELQMNGLVKSQFEKRFGSSTSSAMVVHFDNPIESAVRISPREAPSLRSHLIFPESFPSGIFDFSSEIVSLRPSLALELPELLACSWQLKLEFHCSEQIAVLLSLLTCQFVVVTSLLQFGASS